MSILYGPISANLAMQVMHIMQVSPIYRRASSFRSQRLARFPFSKITRRFPRAQSIQMLAAHGLRAFPLRFPVGSMGSAGSARRPGTGAMTSPVGNPGCEQKFRLENRECETFLWLGFEA